MVKINKNSSNTNKKDIIIKHYSDLRMTFNFSFITKTSRYDLKHIDNKKVKDALLKKIEELSGFDKTTLLSLKKKQGLERIEENDLSRTFKKSGVFHKREKDCLAGYWVFRISSLGRVLGKINQNIFYILAIDTHFDLYDH